jgi:hypothetical protein
MGLLYAGEGKRAKTRKRNTKGAKGGDGDHAGSPLCALASRKTHKHTTYSKTLVLRILTPPLTMRVILKESAAPTTRQTRSTLTHNERQTQVMDRQCRRMGWCHSDWRGSRCRCSPGWCRAWHGPLDDKLRRQIRAALLRRENPVSPGLRCRPVNGQSVVRCCAAVPIAHKFCDVPLHPSDKHVARSCVVRSAVRCLSHPGPGGASLFPSLSQSMNGQFQSVTWVISRATAREVCAQFR